MPRCDLRCCESSWLFSGVERAQGIDIVRRKSRRGRRADVVRGFQQLAIVAEVAGSVTRLPEQVHDVVEVPRVLEAERMSELVERGEVDDDTARERIDFDGCIRGDVHLGGIDQALPIEVRPRLAVVPACSIEIDADARTVGDERALEIERAARGRRPRLHRLLDELIALRREIPPVDEYGNDRMYGPVGVRRGREQTLWRGRSDQ